MTTARTDWQQFWLRWTLFTVAGEGLGFLLSIIVIILLLRFGQIPPQPALLGFIAGTTLGATVGLAQWFVIKDRLPQPMGWVAATGLGWGIGQVLALFITQYLGGAWGGLAAMIALGGSIGLAQLWVIRSLLPERSGWLWPLTWIVAIGFGRLLGLALAGMIGQFWGIVAAVGVGAAVNGLITGNNLAWLLRQQQNVTSDPTGSAPEG